MVATAEEIRSQVARANQESNEAFSAMNIAKAKLESAIAQHMATDTTKLAQTIAQLQQASQRIEEAQSLIPAAVQQAEAYSAIV